MDEPAWFDCGKTSLMIMQLGRGASRRGRAWSQVDILIAALCRHMNVTLLIADRDFEALPDLRTENWLIDPAAK